MNTDMTVEQARELISDVVAERLRWGRNYGTGPYSTDQILDAVTLLARVDNERIMGQSAEQKEIEEKFREEITLLNRQLAAAKARETKLRNDLTALKEMRHAANDEKPSAA